MKSPQVPGCVYLNGSRYWWKVKLPGTLTFSRMPLIPTGATFATNDREVAVRIAKVIWEEAREKALPRTGEARPATTIRDLHSLYRRRLMERFGEDSTNPKNIEYAIGLVSTMFGVEVVGEFGPLKLQAVRTEMIVRGLSRKVINWRIRQIVRMFRWGVSQEKVGAGVLNALKAVEGLRKGEGVHIGERLVYAKERPKVKPVAEAWVIATIAHMQPILRDIVNLHLLTGMRSGEVLRIRHVDLDIAGDVWWYTPAHLPPSAPPIRPNTTVPGDRLPSARADSRFS